ncbi:helix-turn-helix transcriptional regulator [Alkalimarinus alittae]|uniref:helix-turn-helix transcriptional regulator n=1 Tax=Alkalimarinus alittae TaxID=2961619 RepID=UPI003877A431
MLLGDRAVRWVDSEVDEWIMARIEQRDTGEFLEYKKESFGFFLCRYQYIWCRMCYELN